MLKGVIWLDDKKKLKRAEVTMSTDMDWAFARNFQDFLVDKVTEFNHHIDKQYSGKVSH